MVKEKRFSISEAVSIGWVLTKKNFWFLIGVAVIVWAVSFVPHILKGNIETSLKGSQAVLSIVTAILFWVLRTVVDLGVIRITLELIDGKKPKFSDLFSQKNLDLFWRYLGASLLFGLMVVIGFILFIIPGIYLSLKFGMYNYLVVDKGLGPIEALKMSSRITQGAKWDLLLFNLAMLGLTILGVLALFVGLLITTQSLC